MSFKIKSGCILLSSFFVAGIMSCDKQNTPEIPPDDATVEGCEVVLFDGDRFKGPSITIQGPADHADLKDLPNSSGKDWTDEADALKVGKNAILTVWLQTDFKGDSTIYQPGNYPSVDEPFSLKIRCLD